jgi:hypothetical protein
MAEVALQALTRIMVQRNERLRPGPSQRQHIVAHAAVAAGVAVLVAQAAINLGDRMALLARRVVVAAQDRVNDRLERIDDRGHGLALVLLGLGLSQDLADFAPRMMKAAGQLANAHLVAAMRLANAGVLVHLDHPPPPVAGFQRSAGEPVYRRSLRVGPLSTEKLVSRWARFRRKIPN